MTAEELLPKLPKPSELRPFPSQQTVSFIGHSHRILCMKLSSKGQYLASGDNGGLLIVFEVASSRIL
jgi:ribosome biogenesis protein ERB1